MRWIQLLASSVLPLALVLAAVGCGPSGPKTVPVTGKVTIGGQPATNVSVSFVPEDPTLPTASGSVQNGSYTLYSGVEGKPGAVVGNYKVILAVQGGMDAEAYKKASETGGTPGVSALSFPAEYADPSKTPLKKEVKAGGGPIDIEVPGPMGS